MLTHGTGDAAEQMVICQQSPVWRHDVTLPYVPEGLEVSDYIRFIREYDWAATALGHMSTWSLDMRRTVSYCCIAAAAVH